MLRDIGYERDWMTTAELTGESKDHAHSWRLGVNFWWNRQGIQANTGVYAHTIEADPAWLNHNGSQEFAANTGGEYYDGHETKTAIYLSDDWQVTNRWWLSAGVRGEYYAMGGKNAYVYAMQHPNSQDFAGPYMPILDAVNIPWDVPVYSGTHLG